MDQNEQPIIDFTELTAHVVSSYVPTTLFIARIFPQ